MALVPNGLAIRRKHQQTMISEDYMSIDLNREMDRVKSKVFMGNSSAFLGSIDVLIKLQLG
jgi:hypothetical protein